jgi:hypothetical protein
MKPLVKCACPKCGCVVFEPEAFVLATKTMQCIPECQHSAPTDKWIISGAYSRRRPDFWIGLSASMMLTRRLAAEALKRYAASRSYYAGGLRF